MILNVYDGAGNVKFPGDHSNGILFGRNKCLVINSIILKQFSSYARELIFVGVFTFIECPDQTVVGK